MQIHEGLKVPRVPAALTVLILVLLYDAVVKQSNAQVARVMLSAVPEVTVALISKRSVHRSTAVVVTATRELRLILIPVGAIKLATSSTTAAPTTILCVLSICLAAAQ